MLQANIMKKYDQIYQAQFNIFGKKFFSELSKIGHTPLPPYIRRSDNKSDEKTYQTVYAKNTGSAAAPTAGLHFTTELLEKIKRKKIEIINVTLNVGLGTFAPVKEPEIENHKIHSEFYSISENNLKKIIKAKEAGKRIIAVGTTSTRVLETIFNSSKNYKLQTKNCNGWTNIFIYPGYKFKCVGGMITNFHLPKSTLFMLVSAFAGQKKINQAYKEAISQKYRFYSYGDAMLII
jgi:S-adenosylmethionine:tRNA ribosyltransferase-isomerase